MSTRAAVSVLIGAELGASFRGAFSSANQKLTSLGGTIQRLSQTTSNIASFRTMQADTRNAKRTWQQAEAEVRRLSQAMYATTKPSRELQREFRNSVRDARQAKNAYRAKSTSLHEMRQSLRAAGVDTRNLAEEQRRLGAALKNLQQRQAAVQNIQTAQAANKSARAGYRAQMMDAVALGTALYGIIRPAVGFEFAMARVGAITNELADSEGFKQMSALARELGRTTQFTTSQVAESMQYLGMAGFNTQQILSATPAALNLAIAGNLDLARTADIASNILTGFNMTAEETTRVADVLAQVSRITNTNVSMLGYTMKYVAPAAAAVGGSLEETAALAGVLGDAGIQGTMAGTMLRATYLRLAAPTNAAAKVLEELREQFGLSADEMPDVAEEAALAQQQMKDLGVAIFDSEGSMRSLVDILRDMSVAMRGMSDAERLSKLNAIFGQRATVGALAIFQHFETGRLDEVLEKAWNAEGAAAAMAERMKQTTRGAFLEFTSAVESVGISLGMLLLPTLAQVARGAARVTSRVSALIDRFPVISRYLGLVTTGLIAAKIAGITLGYGFTFIKGGVLVAMGAVAKFRAGLALLKTKMILAKISVKSLNLTMLANPIGLIVAAVAVGTALIIANWDRVKEFVGRVWDSIRDGATAAVDWVQLKWQPIGDFFANLWNRISNFASIAFDKISETVMRPINAVRGAVGRAWNWVTGGDRDDTPASANRIAAAELDLAPLNRQAGQTLSQSRTTNYSTIANITINPTPGMSERAIAGEIQRVLAEVERNAQARVRSANYD